MGRTSRDIKTKDPQVKIDELQKRLEVIKAAFIVRFPFFAYFIQSFNIKVSDKIFAVPGSDKWTVPVKTAATNYRDIIFDPNFGSSLSDEELLGTLLHEVMHIALQHGEGKKERDHFLWDVATDKAVNYFVEEISKCRLPQGALPGENDTAEAIYEKLFNRLKDAGLWDKFRSLMQQEGQGQGQQQEGQGQGQGSSGESGEITDKEKERIRDIVGKGKVVDNHDAWDKQKEAEKSMTPDERQALKKIIEENKNALVQSTALSATSMERGDSAAYLNREVDVVLKPTRDWFSYILSVMNATEIEGYSISSNRVNHRYKDVYTWGTRDEVYPDPVVFAIDTSGSIPNDALQVFLNHIGNIIKRYSDKVDFIIIPCDAGIDESKVLYFKAFSPVKAVDALEKINNSLNGGCAKDFRPVFNYLAKKRIKNPAAFFYFTDLDGDFPKPENVPFRRKVFWLYFDRYYRNKDVPFGKVFTIDPITIKKTNERGDER